MHYKRTNNYTVSHSPRRHESGDILQQWAQRGTVLYTGAFEFHKGEKSDSKVSERHQLLKEFAQIACCRGLINNS